MIDARLLAIEAAAATHRARNQQVVGHQHPRVPSMVPMVIDDDDDDDDDDESSHEDEDNNNNHTYNYNDHETSNNLRDDELGEPDRARQVSGSHGNFRGLQLYSLIDGLPAGLALTNLAADDKISRSTYNAGQRSLNLAQTANHSQHQTARHHRRNPQHLLDQRHRVANVINGRASSEDGHQERAIDSLDYHQYQTQDSYHLGATHQHHSNQIYFNNRAFNEQVAAQVKTLDHRNGLDHEQNSYLTRFLASNSDELHSNGHAAIYYQPPSISTSEQFQHRQSTKNLYDQPARSHLKSTSSFLYQHQHQNQHHQRQHHHQSSQQQQQQPHPGSTSKRRSAKPNHSISLHNKPVPPLPPTAARIHLDLLADPNQQESSTLIANSFLSTNANLNYLRGISSDQLAGGVNEMMHASGSRQHLTAAQNLSDQQPTQSALSVSPHLKRAKNMNSNLNGQQSQQLNVAKQYLRPVPNRSTPTPSHTQNQRLGNQLESATVAAATSIEEPTPMSCCGKMAKFLLFVANFVFWAGGIALGAWGILALVEDHKYNLSQLLVFEAASRMSLFQLLSWSFITLGCAIILVGFCGCSAMFKNSRWILGLYIFLILAIFALDLATGLLAIIFQERLVANVRLRLVNKLRSEYGIQASFTAAIDYIQTKYECCGLDGHFDYEQSLWRLQRLGGFEATVARTCCHLRNTFDDQAHVNPRPVNESMCQSTDVRFHQSYRYRRGCLDDLERLIRHKIWTFTICCGAVGAIILISLVFATCFCRSIPNARKPQAPEATGTRVYHDQTTRFNKTKPKHRSSYK